MRNLLELLDEPIGAASDPPTHLLEPSVEIALAWITPFTGVSPTSDRCRDDMPSSHQLVQLRASQAGHFARIVNRAGKPLGEWHRARFCGIRSG